MDGLFKVNGKRDLTMLAIFVLVCEGVGVLSSFFTMSADIQYKSLILPPFAPPAWVYAPVWTILYFLMGVAAYRVWLYGIFKVNVREALAYFTIQLALNFLWSVLFFGLQYRGLAFVEILLLLILILITAYKFYKIDRTAGYLLVPYILWVSFAAVLNYSIWVLNM